MLRTPRKVWSESIVSKQDGIDFLESAKIAGVPEGTIQFFYYLLKLETTVRLTFNLRILLNLLMDKVWVANVLEDGITESERYHLNILEDCNVDENILEIAHGLLSVHQRWLLMKAVRRSYIRAKEYDIKSKE